MCVQAWVILYNKKTSRNNQHLFHHCQRDMKTSGSDAFSTSGCQLSVHYETICGWPLHDCYYVSSFIFSSQHCRVQCNRFISAKAELTSFTHDLSWSHEEVDQSSLSLLSICSDSKKSLKTLKIIIALMSITALDTQKSKSSGIWKQMILGHTVSTQPEVPG